MMKYVLRIPLPMLVRRSLGLVALLFLAGCASPGSPTSPAGAAPTPVGQGTAAFESADALRVGELILIEFSGVSDPPRRHEERIKTDGRVTLPNIGAVQAAGKTRGELEAAIHELYVPKFFRQLTVTVRNEGRFFYVRGQVKNPGQYPYLKEMTVTKAIAVASDFTDFAKKTKVQVIRADGRKAMVDCIKAIHDPKLDLPIFPDDIIEVPRRYF
jgi:polysaccharide export outer membrane protein